MKKVYWLLLFVMLGSGFLMDCGPQQVPQTESSTEPTKQEIYTEAIVETKPGSEPKPSEPAPEPTNLPDAGPTDTPTTTEPTPDNAPSPTFDPTVCGSQPHKWLPTSEVGKLVSKAQPALGNLSKLLLTGLLQQTSYKDLVTIKYGVKVYTFRYTTQDRGKKVEATGVIGIPDSEGAALSAPYTLFLHGTSGFMDKCAPSTGQEGILSVALLASQGYIAIAPDYIGMNGTGAPSTTHHAYLVGEAVALGSLDSLRATDALVKDVTSDVKHDGRLVLIGGSQGGHAALFTALYAPYYAPEYKLVAGVAMIPPVDLVAQSEAAIKTLGNASITLAAGATAMSRWYGFYDNLNEVLTEGDPYNHASTLANLMDTKCDVDAKGYNFTKTTDIFTDALYKAVAEQNKWTGFEKWRCIMAENSLNHTSVKRISDVPFLYIVSEKDELVNPVIQRKSYDTLCQQGYKMNYIECKGASHTKGAVWSLNSQFTWIKDRLDGVPMKNVCQRPAAVCCTGSDAKVCTP
jgi:pimeloyl-ACP methyl ester carboxylesterase